ncbi:hypothetical protein EYF80_039099 [Liparis tanakae]|uniref:Secreted protein n=1 Tax=Liparis tanakae TaxID=230148 RepID=A0A4Z2GBT1_9TELE|nr:hypothetical protein EYF80_039099 [Liparis tanakae]
MSRITPELLLLFLCRVSAEGLLDEKDGGICRVSNLLLLSVTSITSVLFAYREASSQRSTATLPPGLVTPSEPPTAIRAPLNTTRDI